MRRAIAATALALVVAACGSDSDASPIETSASTPASVDTDVPDASDAPDGTTATNVDVAPEDAALCAANAQGEAVGELAEFATAPKDEIAAKIEEMVAAAQAMEDAAPAEVRDDVATVMATQRRLAATIAAADYDFQAVALDPEVSAMLTDADYIAAGRRLQTYVDEHCGISTGN